MKKRASTLTGIILIIVLILVMSYLLQPQDDKTITGEISSGRVMKASTGTTAETSSSKMPKPAANAKAGSSGKAEVAQSPIVVPNIEGIIPDGYIQIKVTKIVDGDTFRAMYNGNEYKVRLLCIDTPETVKEGVSVQPYGQEASEKLKDLLFNKKVTLVFEKEVYDKYERLLAYVILQDGTCVNAFLLEQGYARVETVKPNTVHRDYFEVLQEDAIRDNRGLWSLPADERPFVQKDEGYYIPRFYDDAA